MSGTAGTFIERCADVGSCREAFWNGLEPPARLSIDTWADSHIYLPRSSSEGGRWRTSRTPFLKEIMECLSPMHPCHKVSLKKPAQIGGTMVLAIWAAYTMERSPAPMLIYEPSIDMVRRFTKEKLDPLIEESPAVKKKVREARSRDSSNTTYRKEFLGGWLNMLWADSTKSARSTSAPRIGMDEIDEYAADVGDQGHPCDIVEGRFGTYPDWKMFLLSTPTIEGESRIDAEYLKGSRASYHVPCPFCGHLQSLEWDHLIFTFDGERRPDDAAYQCQSCLRLIAEHHKDWMMDPVRARWVHEVPENDEHRSFRLNLLYQPYGWAYPWRKLAQKFIEAHESLKAGDHRPLKTFTQLYKAQSWKVTVEEIKDDDLFSRREAYPAPCPRGVLVLTAAVDVQGDRLEVEVCGWGAQEESWSIAYRVFSGSPSLPQVWSDLTDFLQQAYQHEDGVSLRVEAVGIDTGGHHTKEGYEYVRDYRKYRGLAYALKGSSTRGALPIVHFDRPKKDRKYRVQVHLVGTDTIKDTIFERVKLAQPGPGYMHFPLLVEYSREYFKGLASEVKKPNYIGKSQIQDGYKYVKQHQRNEPLDLKVYNQATLLLWLRQRRITLEKLVERWKVIAERYKVTTISLPGVEEVGEQPQAEAVPEQPAAKELPEKTSFVKQQPLPGRRRGGFVKGWR